MVGWIYQNKSVLVVLHSGVEVFVIRVSPGGPTLGVAVFVLRVSPGGFTLGGSGLCLKG